MMRMRTYRSLRSASGSIGRLVTTSANNETEASRTIVMEQASLYLPRKKIKLADVDVARVAPGCRTNCLTVDTLHVASPHLYGWTGHVSHENKTIGHDGPGLNS